MKRILVVVIASTAILAAACGSSSEDTSSFTLNEVLGGQADQLLTEADLATELAERVALCMAEQGFEYTPFVNLTVGETPVAEFEQLTDDQIIESYGYGISTLFTPDSLTADGDPNIEYRRALTSGERPEYDRALFGFDLDEGIDGAAVSDGGCLATAQAGFDENFFLLQDRMIDLRVAIRADTQYQALEREWERCMAEAGYGASGWDWGPNLVQRRLGRVIESITVSLNDGRNVPLAMVPGAAFIEGAKVEIDGELLGEIQEEELTIAAADNGCRNGLQPVKRTIEQRYEADFEINNQDLLQRFAPTVGS